MPSNSTDAKRHIPTPEQELETKIKLITAGLMALLHSNPEEGVKTYEKILTAFEQSGKQGVKIDNDEFDIFDIYEMLKKAEEAYVNARMITKRKLTQDLFTGM